MSWWSTETHTFFITCGEFGPLLKDVTVFASLPILGDAHVSRVIVTEGKIRRGSKPSLHSCQSRSIQLIKEHTYPGQSISWRVLNKTAPTSWMHTCLLAKLVRVPQLARRWYTLFPFSNDSGSGLREHTTIGVVNSMLDSTSVQKTSHTQLVSMPS